MLSKRHIAQKTTGNAMTVKSDIEIAREAKMLPIMAIGKRLGIPEKDLIPYGHTKA